MITGLGQKQLAVNQSGPRILRLPKHTYLYFLVYIYFSMELIVSYQCGINSSVCVICSTHHTHTNNIYGIISSALMRNY